MYTLHVIKQNNVILTIQDVPLIKLEDAESVKSILVYFLALLTFLLAVVITYLVKQNNNRFKEKDALIASQEITILEKNSTIVEIQGRLDREVEFTKKIASSTSQVITDNTIGLKVIIKSFEKLGLDVPSIKNVVEKNHDIVKDLKDNIIEHILKK